jgi:uncharacterized protein YoxC
MTVELEFLGKQMERMLGEIGSLREDMTVMMEIMRRMDKRIDGVEHRVESVVFAVNSMSSQLTDMHAYNRRVEARIAKLEADA